jgi:hypothetical protein
MIGGIVLTVLSILLALFAGFSKAVMDLSSQGAFKKSWWNKFQSADNKNHMVRQWTQYDHWIVKYWLILWRWMFRNLLVAFTDGWHLFQFFCFNCLILSCGLQWWLYPHQSYLIIECLMIFKFSFWLFYKTHKRMW